MGYTPRGRLVAKDIISIVIRDTFLVEYDYTDVVVIFKRKGKTWKQHEWVKIDAKDLPDLICNLDKKTREIRL